MKAVVYGVGAVGGRAARQLVSNPAVESVTIIDEDLPVAEEAAISLGKPARVATISALRLETRLERFREVCEQADLVVLTAPDDQMEIAEAALQCGAHVVSVSDD